MRVRKMMLVSLIAAVGVGCGLYEEPATYVGMIDGETCGPSGLGTYSAKAGECQMGPLEGVVQASSDSGALVFVHPNGAEGAPGTRKKPVGSLQKALQKAQKEDAGAVVIAGSSTWKGRIELRDGVSLIGGYNKEWKEAEKTRPTLQSTTSDAKGQNAVVEGRGMREGVTLRNLVLESRGAGKTKYGMRLVDSESVRLGNVFVQGGKGKNGNDGMKGRAGEDGGEGKNAGQPKTATAGSGGTNEECPVANGGAGGRGGFEGASGSRAAEDGETSAAEVNGGGPSEDGFDGAKGKKGAAGENGTKGQVKNGRWRLGASGQDGEDGLAGEGGGGGGGGRVSGGNGIGGGGGGAGAGGCGGQGGTGGAPGGASLGMLVAGSEVTIKGGKVSSSSGGAGGAGKTGGDGGAGGEGGQGASGEGRGNEGGVGGNGGAGGKGGRGGDGRGGVSIGIQCAGSSTLVRKETTVESGQGGKHGGQLSGRAASKNVRNCK